MLDKRLVGPRYEPELANSHSPVGRPAIGSVLTPALHALLQELGSIALSTTLRGVTGPTAWENLRALYWQAGPRWHGDDSQGCTLIPLCDSYLTGESASPGSMQFGLNNNKDVQERL